MLCIAYGHSHRRLTRHGHGAITLTQPSKGAEEKPWWIQAGAGGKPAFPQTLTRRGRARGAQANSALAVERRAATARHALHTGTQPSGSGGKRPSSIHGDSGPW